MSRPGSGIWPNVCKRGNVLDGWTTVGQVLGRTEPKPAIQVSKPFGFDKLTAYAPEAWSRIERAAELEKSNREALDECGKDATRTGKPQRCTIKVDSPTPPGPALGADYRLIMKLKTL